MKDKLIIIAKQVDGSLYKSNINYEDLSEDIKDSGNWWYLHGRLQDDVGYDKGLIENIRPEQVENRCGYPDINLNGEYEVEIRGIDKPCIGYFWIDSIGLGRGLVCYKDDLEEIKFAKENYKEKSSSI